MWLVILLFISSLVQAQDSDLPVVSTRLGLVRGVRDEKQYSKFLGVPYAVVDDTNPFAPSEPHPGFDEIFEANDDSRTCPQINNGNLRGTLPCLNMNIFVPDSASVNNLVPVMVWIHGGAFIGGHADRDCKAPYNLVRQDVVVIGINYRVGIYEFMCLDTPEVPGNQGLKDQTLALRWIRDNIDSYGGDPERVTVFGESAGGMSVNMHLFSNYEKLFDKVVIQSGSALSYWMMVPSDNTVPLRLAAEFDFMTTNINEALAFLSTVEPHALIQVGYDLNIASTNGNNQPILKPCLEKIFDGVENFITEHPMNMRSEKVRGMPVLFGFNNMEFASSNSLYHDTFNFERILSKGFDLSNDLGEAFDIVRHFYLGDEQVNAEKLRWGNIEFGTDILFGHPSQRMAEQLMDSGAESMYRYIFSYNGSRNLADVPGASHTDELPYLFDVHYDGNIIETTPEDQLIIDRLSLMWTNFAKYGNPIPEPTELLPVQWQPMTPTRNEHLEIDVELNILNKPFHQRMAFWDLFYRRFGKYQMWYQDPESDRSRN